MYDYLLRAIISLCILPHVFTTEDCMKTVLAKRDTVYVPEGGSLSLSCDIQNCGDTWTGNWIYSGKEGKTTIQNSDRHNVTNSTLSANATRLFLQFLRVNQSDEGFYGCSAEWGEGITGQGHYIYVNVTAVVATKRKLLHRFLVYASACICVCICFAILLMAHCLRSEVSPQPLPRTQLTSPHSPQNPPSRPVPKKRAKVSYKAPTHSEQKTEVVYADISQDALRQQAAVRESDPSTVYSSVRFS